MPEPVGEAGDAAGGSPLPVAPTDVELVAGMRAGDRNALGTAYDRYATELFDLCIRTGGRDDAEDAVQDTFLSAMASIDQLRGASQAPTVVVQHRAATESAAGDVPTRRPPTPSTTSPPRPPGGVDPAATGAGRGA
ncbi:MAG: hypothetical protein R2714_16210 [Microthrixaceae bacterium]